MRGETAHAVRHYKLHNQELGKPPHELPLLFSPGVEMKRGDGSEKKEYFVRPKKGGWLHSKKKVVKKRRLRQFVLKIRGAHGAHGARGARGATTPHHRRWLSCGTKISKAEPRRYWRERGSRNWVRTYPHDTTPQKGLLKADIIP